MRKSKKRKPDFRRIRPSKSYTVAEIAKALDRSPATVRNWIRDGLPTLDDRKPPLVVGSDLKVWLQAKWAARKQPCEPDELYCCKCHRPRIARPGSVKVVTRNAKTASIKALCHVCGTQMTRGCSLATQADIEAGRHPLSPQLQRLAGCSNAGAKPTVSDPCRSANGSAARQPDFTVQGPPFNNGQQR